MNIFGLANSFMGRGVQSLLGTLSGGDGGQPLQVAAAPGGNGGGLGGDFFNPIQGLESAIDIFANERSGGSGVGGARPEEPAPTLLAGGRKGGRGTGACLPDTPDAPDKSPVTAVA